MKPLSLASIICSVLILSNCATTPAVPLQSASETRYQNSSELTQVRKDVNRILKAAIEYDIATTQKLTHPKVIAKAGGAEGFKKAADIAFEIFKDNTSEIESYKISGPIKLYKTINTKYAVIPTDMVMKIEGNRTHLTGYTVGEFITGKGWLYTSGDKLYGNKVRTLFPDFPSGAEWEDMKITRL